MKKNKHTLMKCFTKSFNLDQKKGLKLVFNETEAFSKKQRDDLMGLSKVMIKQPILLSNVLFDCDARN